MLVYVHTAVDPEQKSQFMIAPAWKTSHFAFFIAKVKPNTFELKRPLTSIIFLCWWIFVFMLICIILKWVWVQLSDFISEIKLSLSTAKHRNKILPVRKLRFHTISFASV